MIIIEGWIRLDVAELERVRGDAVAMMAATRAEEGCEEFAFAQDLADPELFRIIERWRDEETLDAHTRSAHMAAFRAALGAAQVKGGSVNAYTADFSRSLVGG